MLYQLMASVLKNRTHIQTVEYVVRHLEYIRQAVEKTVSEDKISELQQLLTCAELVKAIREEFPDIKIAVGGGAFRSTHEL